MGKINGQQRQVRPTYVSEESCRPCSPLVYQPEQNAKGKYLRERKTQMVLQLALWPLTCTCLHMTSASHTPDVFSQQLNLTQLTLYQKRGFLTNFYQNQYSIRALAREGLMPQTLKRGPLFQCKNRTYLCLIKFCYSNWFFYCCSRWI